MTPIELATVSPQSSVAEISRGRYERLARRVKLLSWLSLGWMTIEEVVAILAGVAASSIAPIGFGLDSAVEGLASVIITGASPVTGWRARSRTATLGPVAVRRAA